MIELNENSFLDNAILEVQHLREQKRTIDKTLAEMTSANNIVVLIKYMLKEYPEIGDFSKGFGDLWIQHYPEIELEEGFVTDVKLDDCGNIQITKNAYRQKPKTIQFIVLSHADQKEIFNRLHSRYIDKELYVYGLMSQRLNQITDFWKLLSYKDTNDYTLFESNVGELRNIFCYNFVDNNYKKFSHLVDLIEFDDPSYHKFRGLTAEIYRRKLELLFSESGFFNNQCLRQELVQTDESSDEMKTESMKLLFSTSESFAEDIENIDVDDFISSYKICAPRDDKHETFYIEYKKNKLRHKILYYVLKSDCTDEIHFDTELQEPVKYDYTEEKLITHFNLKD